MSDTPVCVPGTNTPACQAPARTPIQGTDIVLGQQLNGPTTANQTVQMLIADLAVAIGAGYLPLAGGTMTGPLDYTATGASVSRSAQNLAADVANILNFGADPTGAADSAPAIVAALATGKSVWAPTGIYHLKSGFVVGSGQTFFGDGRAATQFTVDDDFSTSATYVISINGREFDSPTIRDFAIIFSQPSTQTSRANFLTLANGGTSGSGGTGVIYPPAVLISSANRFRILNISVSGAWDGIVSLTSNSIGGFIIDNVEMGALDIGLSLDNCLDFGHIKSWHSWPFGLNAGTLYTDVYKDGNTFAAKFGANSQLNGVSVTDFTIFIARVAVANSATWMHFTNLMLDGGATLEVGPIEWLQISNVYLTGGYITFAGGVGIIEDIYAFPPSTQSTITVSGGSMQLASGYMGATAGISAITLSGGASLKTDGLSFSVAPNWTVPLINAASSGNPILEMTGCSFARVSSSSITAGTGALIHHNSSQWARVTDTHFGPGITGGTAIQIDQSNSANALVSNDYGRMGVILPGGVAGAAGKQLVFSTAGTYTYVPTPGIKEMHIIAIGGGGGGGGGAQTASGTAASGGGAGGGGFYIERVVSGSAIPSSVSITVGPGGAGGAGATSTSSSGTSGGVGGITDVGSLLSAGGGGGGQGGAIAAATGGGGGGGWNDTGGTGSGGTGGTAATAGALSSVGGSGASATTVISPFGASGGGGCSAVGAAGSGGFTFSGGPGGGAGGGITSLAAGNNGGVGTYAQTFDATLSPGGTSGTPNGTSSPPYYNVTPGHGGGGGYGNPSGAGGIGGDGTNGGGGGGGGAALNGSNGGNGGNGGNGLVAIDEIF